MKFNKKKHEIGLFEEACSLQKRIGKARSSAPRDIARWKTKIVELASKVRSKSSSDMAWKFFDNDMRNAPTLQKLHSAATMIAGAAERIHRFKDY